MSERRQVAGKRRRPNRSRRVGLATGAAAEKAAAVEEVLQTAARRVVAVVVGGEAAKKGGHPVGRHRESRGGDWSGADRHTLTERGS